MLITCALSPFSASMRSHSALSCSASRLEDRTVEGEILCGASTAVTVARSLTLSCSASRLAGRSCR